MRGDAMNWTEIKPYSDSQTTYWISGIYKVSTYDHIHFHAYYIPDHYKNWGDNPSYPPCHDHGYHSRFWPTLEDAKEACEVHAARHTASKKTVNRAAEILRSLLSEVAYQVEAL